MVCGILRRHLPPNVRVWVFGSRAKWTTHDGSDLDLAVEGNQPIDHSTMINLSIAFDDSDLPYTVDVVDLKSVNGQFKKIIDEQKVLLVAENSKFASNQWSEVLLGDFAPLSCGRSLPTEKRDSSGDVPVIGSGGVIGYHNVGLTAGHTIVIGRKGTLGAVHYFSGPCWPTDATFYVTGTDPLLVKFKYYLLRTIGLKQVSPDGVAAAAAAAVPRLDRTATHAKLLLVPDEQGQKNIAYVLGTLDARIDLNHGMSRTLDEMAQALFKSWFVDFDPVRAKTDGRWQPGKSLQGLSSHLYDLFPDAMVDSELGKIPKGWTINQIKDIANVAGGATPNTEIQKYWNGTHHWATPEDLSDLPFPVLLDTKRKITDAGLRQTSSGLLPVGTILVSSRTLIGRMAITEIPVAIDPDFIAILPHSGISNQFILQWCRASHDTIINHAGGSKLLEINRRNFCQIPIITSDVRIMNEFDKIVTSLYDKIILNEHSSHILNALRDELSSKLIFGKLQTPLLKNHL